MRQPTGSIQGLSLHVYHSGQVYNLAASVAEYLVADGSAIVEMRNEEEKPSPSKRDRRRKPKQLR